MVQTFLVWHGFSYLSFHHANDNLGRLYLKGFWHCRHIPCKIDNEASQTAAGFQALQRKREEGPDTTGQGDGNGRPLKTERDKARNRATETSVLSYGETRQPPPGAIPNRHAMRRSAERAGRKLECRSNPVPR